MDNKMARREAMALLGAAGAAIAFGCDDNTPTSPDGSGNPACAVTPTETIGPFPSRTDLFRSDIREGKSGTPLTLTLTVVNSNNNCNPVADAVVDLWQCDAAGN